MWGKYFVKVLLRPYSNCVKLVCILHLFDLQIGECCCDARQNQAKQHLARDHDKNGKPHLQHVNCLKVIAVARCRHAFNDVH